MKGVVLNAWIGKDDEKLKRKKAYRVSPRKAVNINKNKKNKKKQQKHDDNIK